MHTITVHHLEESRSLRVLWLLEELGLEYDLQLHRRNPKTMRIAEPDAIRKIHPRGRFPVVVFDGLVLAESGAILEFFAERFPDAGLRPADPALRQEFRFWMHYAEGSLMPPLFVKLLTARVRNAPVPFFIKPVARRIAASIDGSYTDPELDGHFDFIDEALAGKEWFAGDFSVADVQMSFPLQAASGRTPAAEGRKNIQAWLDRVAARPAFQRAVARDKDALAGG